MTPRTTKLIACLVVAIFLAALSKASATVLQVGNPYTPAGANYQIFALQGIDASSPLGKTGFSPQVDRNFEFQDSIGVAYDKGGGTLTNFGLGLYSNAQNQVQSTGLKVVYNNLVSASMVTITVEDFDISTKSTFFNAGKVEPLITLLGPGDTIFASAKPTDIFSALVPTTGIAKGDTWTINFGDLLNNLHLADGAISGFILSADALNGEVANSDPYFLVSVSNSCTPVPEPANYIVGIAGIAFAGLFQMRQLRSRRKSAVNTIQ